MTSLGFVLRFFFVNRTPSLPDPFLFHDRAPEGRAVVPSTLAV